MEIQITPVDERDSSWEDHDPRYRVYLHGGLGEEAMGWTDTYDVTGADLLQVIDWAQAQAGGRLTYAIALVRDERQGPHGTRPERGLVWLVGTDGMSHPHNALEADWLERMLVRRHSPVLVPTADLMPADVPRPYEDGTQHR